MSKLDEKLADVTRARDGWHGFVEKVDAALAEERRRQLAERRTEIEYAVLVAAAHGASIADLKRAYGTKDYRTIRSILDAGAERLAAIRAAVAAEVEAAPVEFDKEQSRIIVRDEGGEVVASLTVIFLEDDAYLLAADTPEDYDDTGLYDGEVAEATGAGLLPTIFLAIQEGVE